MLARPCFLAVGYHTATPPPQIAEHRRGRWVAIFGVLSEGFHDHRFDHWRDRPVHHARGRGGFVDLLAGHALGVAGEGWLSGEAVVEEDADGVEIAPGGGLLAPELLGRHVAGAADDLSGPSRLFLLDEAGDAEVRDLDGAFPRDQDVGGLYIAVDDPAPVRVFERLQDRKS